jgi:hypothetical protein
MEGILTKVFPVIGCNHVVSLVSGLYQYCCAARIHFPRSGLRSASLLPSQAVHSALSRSAAKHGDFARALHTRASAHLAGALRNMALPRGRQVVVERRRMLHAPSRHETHANYRPRLCGPRNGALRQGRSCRARTGPSMMAAAPTPFAPAHAPPSQARISGTTEACRHERGDRAAERGGGHEVPPFSPASTIWRFAKSSAPPSSTASRFPSSDIHSRGPPG